MSQSNLATHPVVMRFESIVPIDNPSKGEELIRAHIEASLRSDGITDIEIDPAGNLFARVPGKFNASTLMLSAHMDSVPPCHGIETVRDTDERTGRPIIRSAGKTILGADDKSGIATILELVHQLAQEKFEHNRPLELLFSTEEEIGLNGAKGFDRSKSQAEYCYVLDGEGRVGMIFNAGPSQNNLQITCTGRASHAGIEPENGLSAIHMAADLINQLPIGRISPDLTSNLGVIEGGKANNVTAPDIMIKGEARSHSEDKLENLLAQFENAKVATLERYQHPQVQPQIDILSTRRYNLFLVPETHVSVTEAKKACDALSINPMVAPMNIGSDAHILNQNNLPTVVLGMGFHFSHSLGEFIYCEELAQAYQMVYWLVTH